MIRHGDLTIPGLSVTSHPALTRISGMLDIRRGAELDAPALASVGGALYVWAEATVVAPALTAVGGALHIGRGAELDAPSLRTVAGHRLPRAEIAAERRRAVALAALARPDALDVARWHCGTAHCIAGWAIHLAGAEGAALERQVGSGTAGCILLGLAAAHLLHSTTEAARAWLYAVGKEPSAGPENGRT